MNPGNPNTTQHPLGLVASGRRAVKNGARYDYLFSEPNFKDTIVNPNGTVRYTVEQMEQVVKEYAWQTAKLAPTLKRESLAATLENIWNFVYHHLQYKLDKEGVEELRTPARAWYDAQILSRNPATAEQAGCDCDCMAIFISCTLTNLNIAHKLRVTAYEGGWQHVYVVVPVPGQPEYNWILDCVLDQFNVEKTYSNKFDYRMNGLGIPVAILSGANDADELTGILSGTDFTISGFGHVEDTNAELGALKKHLVRTRNYIARNPESVVYAGGAKNNLKMLNHAIQHWDTPHRMKALTDVARAEHNINVSMGLASGEFNAMDGFDNPHDLSGIDLNGDDDNLGALGAAFDGNDDLGDTINGLGKTKAPKKFFQNVRKAAGVVQKKAEVVKKKVAENKTVQKVVNNKAVQKINKVAKKAVKAVVRYNPLSLAARGGFLLFLEQGWLGFSNALRKGYLTASEAGLSAEDHAKHVKALNRIRAIFVNTLQGKEENLKKAILKGASKNGLTGQEDGLGSGIVASIVAASAPISAAAKAMDEAGIKDKEGFAKKVANFFIKSAQKIKTVVQKVKDNRAAKNAEKTNNPPAANNKEPGGGEPEKNPDGGSSDSGNESGQNPAAGRSSNPNGGGGGQDGGNDAGYDAITNMADKANKAAEAAAKDPGTEETETTNTANKNNGGGTNTDAGKTTDSTSSDSFLTKAGNFIKENPGKSAIGALVLTTGIVLAVSPGARKAIGLGPKKSLSGVNRGKRRAKNSRRKTRRPQSIKM